MKNETRNLLKKIFDDIRDVIEDTHEKIDKVIRKAVDENYDACKYTQPYRNEAQQKMREKADGLIFEIKTDAMMKANALFTVLSTEIAKWVQAPMPEQVTAVIDTYSKYGLKPSPLELRSLVESASGSYVGERILSIYADSLGIDCGFVSYDEIMGAFEIAKNDVRNSIEYYAGHMSEDHTYLSKYLGLSCGNVKEWHALPIAERTLVDGADTPFQRFERQMLDQTEDDFQILPSTRRQLDKLFADAKDDAARTDIAKTLIQDSGKLSSCLQLYDAKLYADAVTAIAAEKMLASETADRAMHDAVKVAGSAYAAAMSAEKIAKAAVQAS